MMIVDVVMIMVGVLGARPDTVPCNSWEFENPDTLVYNIDDFCAKTSQILTTSQWHTEASLWQNHWWQDKG